MGKSRQITISPSITLLDSPFSTLDHNVKVISGQKSPNHSVPVRQLSVFSALDQWTNGQWTSPLVYTVGHHYKSSHLFLQVSIYSLEVVLGFTVNCQASAIINRVLKFMAIIN